MTPVYVLDCQTDAITRLETDYDEHNKPVTDLTKCPGFISPQPCCLSRHSARLTHQSPHAAGIKIEGGRAGVSPQVYDEIKAGDHDIWVDTFFLLVFWRKSPVKSHFIFILRAISGVRKCHLDRV